MKNYAMRSRQRGLSFIGLVFMLVVLVCAAVVTAQSVPVLLEYQAIMKAAVSRGQSRTAAARSYASQLFGG